MSRDKAILEQLKSAAEQREWVRLLGISVGRLERGMAELKLCPPRRHFTSETGLERAVAFAAMDLAMELACKSTGKTGLVLEEQVRFIKAQMEPQPLVARARVVGSSRRKSSLEAELVNAEGVVVARARSNCYHL